MTWLSQSATAILMPVEREEHSTRTEVGRLRPLEGREGQGEGDGVVIGSVVIIIIIIITTTITTTTDRIIAITSWTQVRH